MDMLTFKNYITEVKISKTKLDYHEVLNPKLWTADNKLIPKVKDQLKKIADTFIEHLDVDKAFINDIVFTGSNTNYNYTEHSDVDIHITANFNKLKGKILPEDYFDAMKSNWNLTHSIKIYGHDVEIYVNNTKEDLVGDASAYSIKNDKWIKEPKLHTAKYPHTMIKIKAEHLANLIDKNIKLHHNDTQALEKINDKIGKMRKAGLTKKGEFSLENLAFKALRNNGYIDKLRKQIKKAEDSILNLEALESFMLESFGPSTTMEFKAKFSNFHPTFRHDGRTIAFDTAEMDKDGLLIHVIKFLEKEGIKIRQDMGDYAAYKLRDNNIVVVKQPKKNGRRYNIELKFAYA